MLLRWLLRRLRLRLLLWHLLLDVRRQILWKDDATHFSLPLLASWKTDSNIWRVCFVVDLHNLGREVLAQTRICIHNLGARCQAGCLRSYWWTSSERVATAGSTTKWSAAASD